MLHRTTIAGLLKALEPPGLTPTQRLVLGSIASGRGVPVSRETIYSDVWGKKRYRPDNAYSIVSTSVLKLRGKGYAIESRSGWGYRIVP